MKTLSDRMQRVLDHAFGHIAKSLEEGSIMRWAIMVPLIGSDQAMELCVCESVEKLLAIVKALCESGKNPPQKFIIERREI